jgi:hypothetical protein
VVPPLENQKLCVSRYVFVDVAICAKPLADRLSYIVLTSILSIPISASCQVSRVFILFIW